MDSEQGAEEHPTRTDVAPLLSQGSPLDGIPADASVLVSGPPLTGKYQLLLSVLGRYADSIIVISTKNGASDIRADFRAIAGDVQDDRIGVVDCTSHPSGESMEETLLVKHAGSPKNLTKVGVKFTEVFETFYENQQYSRVGIGLHSLSQLLMHSDAKGVYQFLQVLMGQVRNAGWLFVAAIDDSVLEASEYHTIQHHFDGVIETRESDSGHRELRIRGFNSATTEWTAF